MVNIFMENYSLYEGRYPGSPATSGIVEVVLNR